MAKLLTITYNDGYSFLNTVSLDPVLYLSKTMFPELKKCRYAEIVENIQEAVLQKIQKAHSRYDFLLLLDNKRKLLFNEAELHTFVQERSDKLLIGRLLGKDNDVQDGKLIARGMDPSCLLVNLKMLEDFSLIPEQTVGDVFFPFFSRIYYGHHKDVLLSKIPGIETTFFRVNLLV